ncbi:MAG: hypothetical protein JKY37_12890 [Nannocystaceae bacterium]|nr:hypothetical protein [Nannocystaceae bacterium]
MDLLASQRWLCASLLVLSACDLLNNAADDGDEGGGVGLVRDEPDGDTSDGDATLLAEPLSRAKKRLRFIGKGAEHLGWKLSALAKMYSLAGAVEVPGWSPEGDGEIRQIRDDDLHTAWTCEHSRDNPCAFGIHFPEAAMVTAIRVNASPNGADDPSRFGRIRTLRVHTAEGWAEDHVLATYEDLYIKLGEGVLTRNLTIEIIDTQSKSATLLRIADFDVYGTAGERRAPIRLDPASLYLRLPSPLWKKTAGGERRLTPPQLVYGGDQGVAKMLSLGSAAYASGTRMLLIEQLAETKCKSHVGSYMMLDLKTRVRVPLGDMGGLPGDVWRHKEDKGFAVGYADEDRTRVHAFLLDEKGRYQRKKSLRASRDTYHDLFERWGVDETPLPRGGGTVEDPPRGCEPASSEDFARPEAARPATQSETATPASGKNKKKQKKRRGKPSRLGGPADRWLSCEFADGVKAFISTGESCGSRFEIAVIDAAGQQLARHGDARKSAHVRVRRVSEQQVLVEVAGKGGEVELFWVSPTAIESAGMGTALALSPPSACRAQCDTPFVNPRTQ